MKFCAQGKKILAETTCFFIGARCSVWSAIFYKKILCYWNSLVAPITFFPRNCFVCVDAEHLQVFDSILSIHSVSVWFFFYFVSTRTSQKRGNRKKDKKKNQSYNTQKANMFMVSWNRCCNSANQSNWAVPLSWKIKTKIKSPA